MGTRIQTNKRYELSISDNHDHCELICLEGGALVIDNPGMREFGVFVAEGGMRPDAKL
jgi:hypothetical protein